MTHAPSTSHAGVTDRQVRLAKRKISEAHATKNESKSTKALRAANDMVTRKSKYGVYVNGKLRTASDDHSIAMGVAGSYMAQGDSVWVAKVGTFVA